MWLRLVQGHQLVPDSSFDPCSGVIYMLLISLCHEQTIDVLLFSRVVYLRSMNNGMAYGDNRFDITYASTRCSLQTHACVFSCTTTRCCVTQVLLCKHANL